MDASLNRSISLTLQDRLIFILYGLYFIMKPFYFWSSGLPQISDIIFVLLMIAYLIKNEMAIRYDYRMKRFLIVGFLFSTYVLIANITWMLILNGTTVFIITSAFYIYNLLITLLVVALHFEYNFKIIEVTYKATLISLIVQIILYIAGGGFSGGRMTAGFNNPNQLGYYALLSFAMLILTSQRVNVKSSGFAFGICISAILCFSSLSKAAMLSYIGMLYIYILSKGKNKKLKKNINVIIIFMIIILFLIYQYNNELITSNELYRTVQNRISSIGTDSDDSLEGRGYDRITEYPQYWILGAGEGEYSRFGRRIEFHSTLGNIQVSYGIVGLSLFIGFIVIALKNGGFSSWYLITFILIYGLTHNGIRNSLFWILIALIACKVNNTLQNIVI